MNNRITKIKELSKEEIKEIQGYFEMKYSIDSLIKVLNEDNESFEKLDSKLYQKLLEDNAKYLKLINDFWNKHKEENNIVLNSDEELFVDFARCILEIRKIDNTLVY